MGIERAVEVRSEREDELVGPGGGQVEVNVVPPQRGLLHPDREDVLFKIRLEVLYFLHQC